MYSVEINDSVDCDIFVGTDRAPPAPEHARECVQCHQPTWALTGACMWCGHDPATRVIRALVGIACVAVSAFFTLKVLNP